MFQFHLSCFLTNNNNKIYWCPSCPISHFFPLPVRSNIITDVQYNIFQLMQTKAAQRMQRKKVHSSSELLFTNSSNKSSSKWSWFLLALWLPIIRGGLLFVAHQLLFGSHMETTVQHLHCIVFLWYIPLPPFHSLFISPFVLPLLRAQAHGNPVGHDWRQ